MRESQPRRWTRDEYDRVAEAGILGKDDRVEVLDGEIVEMRPVGSRHAACVDRLDGRAVRCAVRPGKDLWGQVEIASGVSGCERLIVKRLEGITDGEKIAMKQPWGTGGAETCGRCLVRSTTRGRGPQARINP